QLTRDAVGNVVAQRNFDGSVESTEYNLAGRPIRDHKADLSVVEATYDVMGNPTLITSGNSELRAVKYDICGQPVELRTPAALVSIEYDPGGRVVAEVQNGRRIEYRYHISGNVSRRPFAGSKAGPQRCGARRSR